MAALLRTLAFTCLTQGSHTQLLHSGQDCYSACFKQAGFCEWCGPDMACCQHGLFSDPAECQGDLNFKASGYHECVQPKYGPNDPAPQSQASSVAPAPAPPVSSATFSASGAPPSMTGLAGPQPGPAPAPQPGPALAPQPNPAPAPQPPDYDPRSAADLSDDQLMALLNRGGGANGIANVLGATINAPPAPPSAPSSSPSYSPGPAPAPQSAPSFNSAFSGAAPDLSSTGYGKQQASPALQARSAPSPSGLSAKAADGGAKVWYHRGPAGHVVKGSSSGETSANTSSGKSSAKGLWVWIVIGLLFMCACGVCATIFSSQRKKVRPRNNFTPYSDYDNYASEQPPLYKEVPPVDPMMGHGRPGSMGPIDPMMGHGRPGSMNESMAMSNMVQEQRFQSNLMPTDSIPSQTPWTSLQQHLAPSPVQPAVMQEVQAQPVTAPSMASAGPLAYSGAPQISGAYSAAGYRGGLGQTVAAPSSLSAYTTPQTLFPGATAPSSLLMGSTAHYNTPQTILPGSAVTPQASAAPATSITMPGMTSMQVPSTTIQPGTLQGGFTTTAQPVMTSMQVSGGAPMYVAPPRYLPG